MLHHKSFRINNKSAFTLIELLVVIAIIAILASILFPVFARARENARRATCQSNLKQLCLGITQYSQDYDERFPIASQVNPGSISCDVYTCSWDTAIQPYLGLKVSYTSPTSPLILQCPNDTKSHWVNNAEIRTRSYSMVRARNGCNATSAQGVVTEGVTPRLISEIPEASNTLLLVEDPYAGIKGDTTAIGNVFGQYSGATVDCPVGPCVCGAWTSFPAQDRQDPGKPIHFDGWNYAFVDGHVKWLRPQSTFGPGGTGINPKGMWTIAAGD